MRVHDNLPSRDAKILIYVLSLEDMNDKHMIRLVTKNCYYISENAVYGLQ